MKARKNIIFTFLILISLAGFAQESLNEKQLKKASEMATVSDKLMQDSLSLTEEQIPKVSEINLDFSKKMIALFAKPGSKFGKIGDMKKNAKDRNSQLEKVLNSEQMEIFEDKVESKIKKEMRKIVNKDS